MAAIEEEKMPKIDTKIVKNSTKKQPIVLSPSSCSTSDTLHRTVIDSKLLAEPLMEINLFLVRLAWHE